MKLSLSLFFPVALVEYKNISGKTLQQSIEGEMSGDLEELLVAIGDCICLLICSVVTCNVLILTYGQNVVGSLH